jgi:glyoxylase-like metal-dependent hydrolase (beta-lactamase superfamily II)
MEITTIPVCDGIHAIDCHYIAPEKMSVYLLVQEGRAAFVDVNTRFAAPRLLAALDAHGLKPEDVDHVFLTHVHLDHAGGAAEMLRHCPRATLLGHPKAVRHACHPARLIEGARAVYGDTLFRQLYGEIEAVPEARARAVADGKIFAWRGRPLRFFFTLGHATHHACIHDPQTDTVFTGDNFGMGRSTRLRSGPGFTVCSCTPPEFDPAQARRAVADILATGARRACMGHFGPTEDLQGAAAQLLRAIDSMEAILRAALTTPLEGDALEAFISERVVADADTHLRACGVLHFEEDRRWLDPDLAMNALGLRHAVERLRRKGHSAATSV